MTQRENIELHADDVVFDIAIIKNASTEALMGLLPMNLKMEDLNGNEKYCYIDHHLPTSIKKIEMIKRGDVMLFGDDCLVIFYKDHMTTYSYTTIGHIDDMRGFEEALSKAVQLVIR